MHYTIDQELDRTFAVDQLRRALHALHDNWAREAKIITLFYGLDGQEPLTFEHIGKQFGITRQRASQLRDRGIRILRESHRALFVPLDPLA
jgi:RNA polymerase primary sigma factor